MEKAGKGCGRHVTSATQVSCNQVLILSRVFPARSLSINSLSFVKLFYRLKAGALAKSSPRLLMVILESCFFKEDL